MDEQNEGRPGLRGSDVEGASQLQSAEVERDWAARRLEIYRGLDTAIQQAVGGVLNAAAETRQAIEQEAKQILDRLRHERSRLVEDIRDYRRQREGLAAEIAETRRRAEEEAARIRRTAEGERVAMLREAEARKAELTAEVQRLEQQLADVSSGIQALLQEQIGRARGDVGAAGAHRARAPRPPAEAPPPRGEPEELGAVAAVAAGPPPEAPPPGPPATPAGPAPTVRPAAQPAAPAAAEADAPAAVAPPEAPGAAPASRGRRPAEPAAQAAGLSAAAEIGPAGAAAAAPPPPPSAATGYGPTGAPVGGPGPAAAQAPPGLERREVAVTNTPSFARALEFQRGVQRTEGVSQVQALQFEHGTLLLAVDHEPGLDLAGAIEALPNLGLRLTSREPTRLEFAFPPA
ncbi:MAG TPA: hypothetical protein VG370_10725 [Chloroflexota bacterium]|nr:hypothetical protein [Chloroflexota bacterium]